MPRFFSDTPPAGGNIIITGDDARHIGYSLRMAAGETVTVCCGGTDYVCRIEKITPESVFLSVVSSEQSREPTVSLTLYQALPKTDKLEFIIQKSVELGAVSVVPVMTKRCVSRPDGQKFEKKLERLRKISLEAAKQSGRGIIPGVSGIIPFEECLDEMSKLDVGLICYEGGGKRLREISFPKGGSIGLLIGPEGGFEPSEAEKAVERGLAPVWLGDRILRCETAPLAAISIIMNLTDNI